MFRLLWKIFTYGERPEGSLPEREHHSESEPSVLPSTVSCPASNTGVPLPPGWEVVALIAPSDLVKSFRAQIAARAAWAGSGKSANVDGLSLVDYGGSHCTSVGLGSGISEPAFNIDGSPMVGDIDIHGNPYGVTNTGLDWGVSGPAVNIDGSPMIGDIDIHGNPYGVTDTGLDWGVSGPAVNIDGSPMIGDIDIHGNPYGVTND